MDGQALLRSGGVLELLKAYSVRVSVANAQVRRGVTDLPDFAVFRRPSGDTVEVFGPDAALTEPDQFSRNPVVVGFLVDDIDSACRELEAAGIELLGDLVRLPSGSAWQHFRGLDGNTWELSFDPDHPSVRSPS